MERQDLGLPVVCASTHLHLAYVTGEHLAVNLEPGTDDYLANVGTYAVSMAELKRGGGGNVFLDWPGHTLWLNKVFRRMVYPKSLFFARVNVERTKAAEARSKYDGVPRDVIERLCPMVGIDSGTDQPMPVEVLRLPRQSRQAKQAG
jgi:hypothetical protein